MYGSDDASFHKQQKVPARELFDGTCESVTDARRDGD
jgi:hypothetical protein